MNDTTTCIACDAALTDEDYGETWASDPEVGAWHIAGTDCFDREEDARFEAFHAEMTEWQHSDQGQADLLRWAMEDEADLLDSDY